MLRIAQCKNHLKGEPSASDVQEVLNDLSAQLLAIQNGDLTRYNEQYGDGGNLRRT